MLNSKANRIALVINVLDTSWDRCGPEVSLGVKADETITDMGRGSRVCYSIVVYMSLKRGLASPNQQTKIRWNFLRRSRDQRSLLIHIGLRRKRLVEILFTAMNYVRAVRT